MKTLIWTLLYLSNLYTICLNNYHKARKSKPGFTIVELLVVIVVIGILAAISIVSYTGISNKAVVSALQSDLNNISKQLKIYQTINGGYPVLINDCPTPASNNICVKLSSGNSISTYNYGNNNPQSFNLLLSNGSNYYMINDNGSPTLSSNLWQGLVAYWPIDGNTSDISGKGLIGVWNGTSSHYVSGRVGTQAGQFLTANGDYITITTSPSYSNFTDSSYSFWNIPTAVGVDSAVITYAGQLCQSSTSNIRCWVNTSNESFTYNRAASGSWEHVVVTISFTTNQMKVYTDGQLRQTNAITVTKNTGSYNEIFIGQYRGNTRRFSGSLDDVRVYNKTLSDQEVADLYASYP